MVDAVALVPSEGVSLADIDTALTVALGMARLQSAPLQRTYYDTFDGALYRAGLVVEHEHFDDHRWLRVRRVGETTALVQAAVADMVPMVAQLADRRLRAVLEEPAGGRAMLAVVSAVGEVHRYGLLDRLDKTVVRVTVVAAHAMASPKGSRHLLDPVLTVAAVRGHERAFAEAVEEIGVRLGPRPAIDPLRRAAGAAGVALGVDPSDRSVVLSPGAPAFEALRAITTRAAEVLAANVDGVKQRTDLEFLHDFRVTLRATRAVVQAAQPVLDAGFRTRLSADLQRLMALNSPLRDLDVLRHLWSGDAALAPLDAVLAQDAERAHRALVAALEDPAFEQLLSSLRAPEPGPDRRSGATWAADALQERLRALHRATRRVASVDAGQGTEHPPGAADPLHEARKAAKRLRYLLDAFASLGGHHRLQDLRIALKAVQRELGAYQDAMIAAEVLASAGVRIVEPAAPLLIELGRRSEQQRASAHAAAERFVEAYRPIERKRRRFARHLGNLANLSNQGNLGNLGNLASPADVADPADVANPAGPVGSVGPVRSTDGSGAGRTTGGGDGRR